MRSQTSSTGGETLLPCRAAGAPSCTLETRLDVGDHVFGVGNAAIAEGVTDLITRDGLRLSNWFPCGPISQCPSRSRPPSDPLRSSAPLESLRDRTETGIAVSSLSLSAWRYCVCVATSPRTSHVADSRALTKPNRKERLVDDIEWFTASLGPAKCHCSLGRCDDHDSELLSRALGHSPIDE